MKFEEIQEMWRKDSVIDSESLDKEALRIPQLFSKYLDILSVKKFQLDKIESDVRKMRRLRYLYYRGVLDSDELKKQNWEPWQLAVSKNTDVQNCIEGDSLIESLLSKRSYIQVQVDFLDSVVRMISNRSFQIRDSISWTKFVNGVD